MRLADHVVEKLLALVQARGIQPGQRLPAERQLATELGVSRTSVREAIQKLISQGVLATRRGAGTYVQSSAPAEWLQDAMGPLVRLIND
ncbi:MAG: GntR family transcriptional regulator, partial [Comamonas sp.]